MSARHAHVVLYFLGQAAQLFAMLRNRQNGVLQTKDFEK